MKLKIQVLRRFRNKYSKKIHAVGDVVEVSPNRYSEIEKALPGYVAIIEGEGHGPEEIETEE